MRHLPNRRCWRTLLPIVLRPAYYLLAIGTVHTFQGMLPDMHVVLVIRQVVVLYFAPACLIEARRNWSSTRTWHGTPTASLNVTLSLS